MNLKNKLKAKQYRFLQNSYDRTSVRFSKDNLREITTNQGDSFQLEVIEKEKLGYASYNQPDEDLLIEKAITGTQYGDKASYQYPKKQPLKSVKLYDAETAKLDPHEAIKLGNYFIKSLKEADPNILVDVHIDASTETFGLDQSAGVSEKLKASSFSVYVEGDLTTEGDILGIGQFYGWRKNTLDKKKFIDQLKNRFIMAQTNTKTEGGTMTIVFHPEVVDTLFEFFETALSGESLFKKVSKWQDSLEKQVADVRFTMIDDPLIDFALGSSPIDDEGHVIEKMPLIENGILKNYILDLKNAIRLKMKPNGRGFGLPASPDTTNILVTPGTKSKDQIIKSIKKGIYVDQIIGGGQDNPYAGDFTYNIHLGFLIENGEIVGRVKNCVVSGNIFEMIKNQIAEISSDCEWYGGSKNLPYTAFENMNVVTQK